MNTKKKRVILITSIVIVAYIIVAVLAWVSQYNYVMSYKNDSYSWNKQENIPGLGLVCYKYSDNDKVYNGEAPKYYNVQAPKFELLNVLFFRDGGNINTSTVPIMDENGYYFIDDYAIDFMCFPHIIGKNVVSVQVSDLKEANGTMTDTKVNVTRICYDIDENFELTGDLSDYTEHELKVYSQLKDKIKEVFQNNEEFYGKSIFG